MLRTTDHSLEIKESVHRLLEKNMADIMVVQGSDGSIHAPCASRILESTLMLKLLRDQSFDSSGEKRITKYLLGKIAAQPRRHNNAIEAILFTMAEVQVGMPHTDPICEKQLVKLFSNREEGRKTIYFGCLLAETGVLPFSKLPFDHTVFDKITTKVQTWARVMLIALKAIYYHGTKSLHDIGAEEKELLLKSLFEQDVIENNVLTQIVGLLALSKILPKKDLEAPLRSLMAWQKLDGGFPLMTGLDNFVTPLAGLAMLDALPYLSPEHRSAVRVSVKGMTNYLAGEQLKNGGWSYMSGTSQADMDDSGLCAALLARVDANAHLRNLEKAENYFKNMHNQDGGFPTYIKNNESTASMTAAALHGIAEIIGCYPKKISEWQDVISSALLYLQEAQSNEGTFERRWSRSETHAMYRVVMALHSVQKIGLLTSFDQTISKITLKINEYLHENQNKDGGWGFSPKDGSDPISTAYAVLCFSNTESGSQERGICFLVNKMLEAGPYEPDLLGPRPIPYDIPVFTQVIQTHALAHFMKTTN